MDPRLRGDDNQGNTLTTQNGFQRPAFDACCTSSPRGERNSSRTDPHFEILNFAVVGMGDGDGQRIGGVLAIWFGFGQ